jgi:hypothetical protein
MMDVPMRFTMLFLAGLMNAPAPVRAQSPDLPPKPLTRVALTASAGLFTADREQRDSACCTPSSWSSGLFKGAGAGFYWTDHLKTEAEIAWPGETHGYSYFNERIAASG